MTRTSEDPDGSQRHNQIIVRRRGAGIILAIFTILFLMGTGAARRAQAQTYIVLHNFSGSDGQFPLAGLVRDSAGNLYGTTEFGGSSTNCARGCGTVFKLSPSATLTVLHSFSGGSDGKLPLAGLVMDSHGNLYGTTSDGGSGNGTVFELNTSGGGFTVLHTFAGYPNDGATPAADLVMDSHGNLYGTTANGGSGDCSDGCGTVFKLDPSGTLTLLHNFAYNEGIGPQAGLLMGPSHTLYGTTYSGGSGDCSDGCGTVFKLDTSGGGFAVLHSFAGYEISKPSASDGGNPGADLVMDSHGNLYGTTYNGGSNNGGTVFKLDPSGTLTLLHSFAGSDGANPYAGLVRDSYGNLYGTTYAGGSGNGTVFELDPSDTLTLLHSFDYSDGANPAAGLVTDSYGNLYGTTFGGGSPGYGTVFVISTTPQGAIQFIITQVNSLLAQGVINGQQGGSLIEELNLAIGMIDAGKINNAITDLESFITQVTALENSNVLTSDQATALITSATDVIAQLQ